MHTLTVVALFLSPDVSSVYLFILVPIWMAGQSVTATAVHIKYSYESTQTTYPCTVIPTDGNSLEFW